MVVCTDSCETDIDSCRKDIYLSIILLCWYAGIYHQHLVMNFQNFFPPFFPGNNRWKQLFIVCKIFAHSHIVTFLYQEIVWIWKKVIVKENYTSHLKTSYIFKVNYVFLASEHFRSYLCISQKIKKKKLRREKWSLIKICFQK